MNAPLKFLFALSLLAAVACADQSKQESAAGNEAAPTQDVADAEESSAEENAPAQAPVSPSIHVSISGLRNTEGQLLASLFDQPEGFPDSTESMAAILTIPLENDSPTFEFTDLQPGTYAISVVHDENSDGELETNLIGIPKEGVGMSNNPGGFPKFEKSKFEVDGKIQLEINVDYLLK